MAILFDKINKIVQVEAPQQTVFISEIYDAIKEWDSDPHNMEVLMFALASGGEDLGGGVSVGFTLTLVDWKLQFIGWPGPGYVACEVTGGNLLSYDTGGGEYVNPIEPIPYVTVTRTTSASATVNELEAIQYASYQNAVWLDIGSSNSGTDYPVGTREFPVNNLADAVAIAVDKGFSTLEILASITLDGGTNLDGYTIHGHSISNDMVTIAAAASVVDCIIQNCTVDGTLDGGATIEGCVVLDLTYLNGLIHNSMLQGTIQLGGSDMARILDCHSDVPGATTPTIDCGGSGQALSIRNYNGGVKLINKTGSEAVSIDLNSGHIILDATVTDGTIVCRGVGKLTDNSVGATVVNELLYIPYMVNAVWDEDMSSHSVLGSAADMIKFINAIEGGRWRIVGNQMIFYEEDNSTEVARFDLTDQGGSPAMKDVFERQRV